MTTKILVLTFLMTSAFAVLPANTAAAAPTSLNAVATTPNPQVQVRIGTLHDRGRHRGWHRGRRITYYHYSRPNYVRHVYYVNGRRYYRWYRYD